MGMGWQLEKSLELFSNLNDSVIRRAKPCQSSQQRVLGSAALSHTSPLLRPLTLTRLPSARCPQQHPAFPQLPRPRPRRHSRPGRAASRSRHLLLPVVETHAALLEHQRLSQLQQPAGPGEPIHGGPGGTLPQERPGRSHRSRPAGSGRVGPCPNRSSHGGAAPSRGSLRRGPHFLAVAPSSDGLGNGRHFLTAVRAAPLVRSIPAAGQSERRSAAGISNGAAAPSPSGHGGAASPAAPHQPPVRAGVPR